MQTSALSKYKDQDINYNNKSFLVYKPVSPRFDRYISRDLT